MLTLALKNSALSFSPDGRTRAVAGTTESSTGSHLELWFRDVQSGTFSKINVSLKLDASTNNQTLSPCLEYAPNGTTLVLGTSSIQLINTQTGSITARKSFTGPYKTAYLVRAIFSPDCKTLAITTSKRDEPLSITLLNAQILSHLRTIPVSSPVHGLAFSRNTSILAVHSRTKLALYDVPTGRLLRDVAADAPPALRRGQCKTPFSHLIGRICCMHGLGSFFVV